MKTKNSSKNVSAEEMKALILEGLRAAVEAGRVAGQETPKDAYKATERRLYALPTLKARVLDLKEELEEIEQYGVRERHNSFTCYLQGGSRLDPDEVKDVLVQNKKHQIARDECEIERVEKALTQIAKDPYCAVVYGRYTEGLSDDEIAKKLGCDPSTVRRNRTPLVQRIAVWLYGADAV